MNLSKSREFFNPDVLGEKDVHVIGCGSVGSAVAEGLARMGVKSLVLWDMDVVEEHNLANQMFSAKDVGQKKAVALWDSLVEINPELAKAMRSMDGGWDGQRLSGYAFLCVDSIELRRRIVEDNMENRYIEAMFDFRTGLADFQLYAADWSDRKARGEFLKSMQFTHEEAQESTPLSACGLALGANPTVRVAAALGIANFVNFTKGGGLKKMVLMDAFGFTLDAF